MGTDKPLCKEGPVKGIDPIEKKTRDKQKADIKREDNRRQLPEQDHYIVSEKYEAGDAYIAHWEQKSTIRIVT